MVVRILNTLDITKLIWKWYPVYGHLLIDLNTLCGNCCHRHGMIKSNCFYVLLYHIWNNFPLFREINSHKKKIEREKKKQFGLTD